MYIVIAEGVAVVTSIIMIIVEKKKKNWKKSKQLLIYLIITRKMTLGPCSVVTIHSLLFVIIIYTMGQVFIILCCIILRSEWCLCDVFYKVARRYD